MANCAYCGTKLEENAKFCTACGAAAEPEVTPVQSYTPPKAEEPASVQGSYTSPVQGTYTPAGSYTPPVQTPTSAAADSGSYTPPVQNSVPGGNYIPKAGKVPHAPKGPAKKNRLVTLGAIALAVILLISLVSSCGGGADADDPNLGVYNAVTAEMWGMEMPITDMFENGVSIELKEKGKCEMNIDGTTGRGKWTLEDGIFSAEAGGAELNGTLANGVLVAENVLDMGVTLTFEKEGGFVPVPEEEDVQQEAVVDGESVPAVDTAIQHQWNGTWYGMMYVYEAEGDFADISEDACDAYMVVDVDDTGYGTFEVYIADMDVPFAVGECNAMDYGMDAQSGTVIDTFDMDVRNWMFRPVPDYPDRYTVTDAIEYDDSLLEYTLFFKQWGKSWQDEIEGDELIPPSVDAYEDAIANAELPPIGFAPMDYAGQVPAVDDIADAPLPPEEAEANAPAGESGFGGTHSFTIDEFMTGIEATFTYELPDSGWVTEAPNRTVYIYNVDSLDVAHSAAPRIQFELKENMDKIDFYKDQFQDLKEIESRTISGIEFAGRSYVQHNMEWIEYYGELPGGVWLSAKVSGVDISDGTEGCAILDSVKIS